MNNYLINKDTLVILPYNNQSIVIEKDRKFIVKKNPNNIIKANCNMYGSSYAGRLDGTKKLTGYTYKAPIIIEDKNNTIFFPTSSPRFKNAYWINLDNVEYAFQEKNINKIMFNNGFSIKINASLNIINNQILRATRLSSILSKNNA
ncbi:MAG: competence protein ComK [Bacilli bacterium]|nr:competence protein ComK [Bacilli bacterium]